MDKLKDEIEEAYGISPTAIALREAHANRRIGKIRRNGRFK